MLTLNPIPSQPAASSATSSTASSSSSTNSALPNPQSLNNMFLQLLVAQLQNQNPLNPMDPTQFVGQLAQFSELSEVTSIYQLLQQSVPGAGGSGGSGSSGGTSSTSSSSTDTSTAPTAPSRLVYPSLPQPRLRPARSPTWPPRLHRLSCKKFKESSNAEFLDSTFRADRRIRRAVAPSLIISLTRTQPATKTRLCSSATCFIRIWGRRDQEIPFRSVPALW